MKPAITPSEWDATVTQRIQAMAEEWNELSVDDRFWIVFNWLKAYQVLEPTRNKEERQLFMPKPYWQENYKA